MDAAVAVLDERGLGGFSIDEVARRSKVGKATIYKHWRSPLDLAVSAYGAVITEAVPVRRTGEVVTDLIDQVGRLAAAYAGPRGVVVAQLLAAGVSAEGGSALLREGFFAARRLETASLIAEGMARGQLRDDLAPELVIDLHFGPVVFHLFNGQPALSPDDAQKLAALALDALRPVESRSTRRDADE
jgi:AcrR family transcriptional regulator